MRCAPRTSRITWGCSPTAGSPRPRALAAISGYYRRAVHEQAVPANPCAFVARPTPAADKQVQARSISRAQATTLLMAGRERSALHELLVCLLFFNGLRVSEAAAALVGDVDEHGGHRVLWVRGKGETETNQRVPLNAPTVAALERWLPVRAAIAGAEEQLLLLGRNATVLLGSRLAPKQARRRPPRGRSDPRGEVAERIS
jgi:site-specific recombinase XerC